MKVLFLDIDGVLNSREYMKKIGRGDVIDPRCVLYLNEVINTTNCNIVVSSAWRNIHTWPELLAILEDNGVNVKTFIGKTPDRFHQFKTRGDEIIEWIEDYSIRNDVDLTYAVVDDELTGLEKVIHRTVKTSFTDPNGGLNKEKAQELIKMLNT